MKLIEAYTEQILKIESSIQNVNETLKLIQAKETNSEGHQIISSKELETLNSNVISALETIKAVKNEKSENIKQSLVLENALELILDQQTNSYAYATSVYSSSNLSNLDADTASALKRILREYFAKFGLSYEGWN